MSTPTYVILLAGGSGTRMGLNRNKVLLALKGIPVIIRSALAFVPFQPRMILVCRKEDTEEIRSAVSAASLPFSITFTEGGATRQESVAAGLALIPDYDADAPVLVHDGARCLVDEDTIRNVLDSVLRRGNGVASVSMFDTVKAVDTDLSVRATLPRETLRTVQTPQGFRAGDLKEAMKQAEADGFVGTDDASLMEHLGKTVYLTAGHRNNLKLTEMEDLSMAEKLLGPDFRVGQGYDVHRLVPGRKLILCGVEIPHETGLLGHSDADVALHALMDALLGAAALGDIGKHFPDTDPAYAGISSLKLLEHVAGLLRKTGVCISNVDVTIVAQRPKLAPYIPEMKQKVALTLGLEEGRVSIKATTTEKLGFEGREEGISAQAVCLLTY